MITMTTNIPVLRTKTRHCFLQTCFLFSALYVYYMSIKTLESKLLLDFQLVSHSSSIDIILYIKSNKQAWQDGRSKACACDRRQHRSRVPNCEGHLQLRYRIRGIGRR